MEKHEIFGVWHRYQPATVLKITGEDAFSFLQGQFTQDLKPCLKSEFFAYGLWLNQKGKVLADSFVTCRGAEWWCVSLFSEASAIRERLEAYVIADDVTVEDVTAQWAGVAFLGAGAAGAVAAKAGVGFVFSGRRAHGPSWEWLYPVSSDEGVVTAGGLKEVNLDDMERFRIEAGIPAVPRDIGAEDLPNEGGLEREAISYSKGCYLGQEVMARLKTMGQVRRRLMVVEGRGAVPEVLPAEVFVDGKRVGAVRSAVRVGDGFVGLAMFSLLAMTGRSLLSFSPESLPNIVIKNES